MMEGDWVKGTHPGEETRGDSARGRRRCGVETRGTNGEEVLQFLQQGW